MIFDDHLSVRRIDQKSKSGRDPRPDDARRQLARNKYISETRHCIDDDGNPGDLGGYRAINDRLDRNVMHEIGVQFAIKFDHILNGGDIPQRI